MKKGVNTMDGVGSGKSYPLKVSHTVPHNGAAPPYKPSMRKKKKNNEPSQWVSATQISV